MTQSNVYDQTLELPHAYTFNDLQSVFRSPHSTKRESADLDFGIQSAVMNICYDFFKKAIYLGRHKRLDAVLPGPAGRRKSNETIFHSLLREFGEETPTGTNLTVLNTHAFSQGCRPLADSVGMSFHWEDISDMDLSNIEIQKVNSSEISVTRPFRPFRKFNYMRDLGDHEERYRICSYLSIGHITKCDGFHDWIPINERQLKDKPGIHPSIKTVCLDAFRFLDASGFITYKQ